MTAESTHIAEENFDNLQDLNGRLIAGRYRLTRFISAGGFGAVYEGLDEKFVGKKVAIKLCIQISSENAFLREAQLLGQLNHDNIVRVFDQGVHKGIPYIVMELLTGESLEDLLHRYNGQLPDKLLVRFVRDVGRALSHAHKHHLVHRDLKPSNVQLVDTGDGEDASRGVWKFVLLDFGIAAKTNSNCSLANKTFAGAGTPEYMAPEQVRSEEPSEQTDIYTFGVLLYQLLTGQVPFPLHGESYADIARVMTAIVEATPVRPTVAAPAANIAPAIDDLIMECLNKDPARRPRSMNEVRKRFLAVYEPNFETSASGITMLPGVFNRNTGTNSGPYGSPGKTTLPAPYVLPLAMILAIIFSLVGVGAAVVFLPNLFPGNAPTTLSLAVSEPKLQVTAGDQGLFLLTLTLPEGEAPVAISAVGFPAGVTHNIPESTLEKSVNIRLDVDLNAPTGVSEVKIGGEISGDKEPLLAETTMSLEILPPKVWMPDSSGAGKFTGVGKIRKTAAGNLYERLNCQVGGGIPPMTFLLIESRSNSPKIPPFYILETKVPQGVFRQFIKEFSMPQNAGNQDAWQAWMDSEIGKSLITQQDNLPAWGVTANEAFYFCRWLAGELGHLPTRRQWWAAAGFYDRDRTKSEGPYLNAEGQIFLNQPGPVGTAVDDVAEAFGCRDMAGNGMEWTRDFSDLFSGNFPATQQVSVHLVSTGPGVPPVTYDSDGNLSLEINLNSDPNSFSVTFPPTLNAFNRGQVGLRVVLDIP